MSTIAMPCHKKDEFYNLEFYDFRLLSTNMEAHFTWASNFDYIIPNYKSMLSLKNSVLIVLNIWQQCIYIEIEGLERPTHTVVKAHSYSDLANYVK